MLDGAVGVASRDGLAPHLHYAEVDDDLMTRLRARTAAGLAHVLMRRRPEAARQLCEGGCAIVDVDTSRNGRRRFCTLRCANRVRTAEHHSRKSSAD